MSPHTDGYRRGGCRPEDQHVQIEEGGGEKKTGCYFLERHLVPLLITTADRKQLLASAGCRTQVLVDKNPTGTVSTASVLLPGTHNVLRLLGRIKAS